MGNAFAKNYDAPKEHTATVGRDDFVWRIWPGRHRESGAEASIWVFDKGEIGKRRPGSSSGPGGVGLSGGSSSSSAAAAVDKAVVEQILHVMKKDMMALKELAGAGKVVQFYELIEESKGGVIFTTERIVCSLADILDGFDLIPGGRAAHRDYFGDDSILSELEISRGLYNIVEAIQCLHNVHRRLHMNINPASIVLTATGEWKLCGLGFSLGFKPGESSVLSPYFLRANLSPIRLEPDLCYCAPEVSSATNSIRSVNHAVDMFSLGVVAYELYYTHKHTAFSIDSRDKNQQYKLISAQNNNIPSHQMAIETLANLDYSVLPPAFVPIQRLLLSTNPTVRMTTSDVINSAYFTTGPLATLRNLDSLLSKDIGSQSSLLATLPGQLSTFPTRLLENSVLIPVCAACLANPNLWTFAIPVHCQVVQYITRFKYRSITGPFVKKAFEDAKSVEIMLILIKNIKFFIECFSDSDSGASSKPLYIGDAIVLLFSNALDKSRHPIQVLALQMLCDPLVRHGISVQSMVNVLVPKICREACKNPDPNVKLHGLYMLSLITNCLDKQFIIENILPSLKYIIDHDKNNQVAMAVVGNYEVIADILGADYIALAILPAVFPMMVDRTLDNKQADTLLASCTLLMKRVVDMRIAEMSPSKPTWSLAVTRESQDINGVLDPFAIVKKSIETAFSSSEDIYKPSSASLPFKTESTHSSPPPIPSSAPDFSTNSASDSNINIVRVKKIVPVSASTSTSSASYIPSNNVVLSPVSATPTNHTPSDQSNVSFVSNAAPVKTTASNSSNLKNDIDMSDFLQSFSDKTSGKGNSNGASNMGLPSNSNLNSYSAPVQQYNNYSNNSSTQGNGSVDLFGGMNLSYSNTSSNAPSYYPPSIPSTSNNMMGYNSNVRSSNYQNNDPFSGIDNPSPSVPAPPLPAYGSSNNTGYNSWQMNQNPNGNIGNIQLGYQPPRL